MGVGAFVTGLSQISSFFSYILHTDAMSLDILKRCSDLWMIVGLSAFELSESIEPHLEPNLW